MLETGSVRLRDERVQLLAVGAPVVQRGLLADRLVDGGLPPLLARPLHAVAAPSGAQIGCSTECVDHPAGKS